jgi:hypothetical protein
MLHCFPFYVNGLRHPSIGLSCNSCLAPAHSLRLPPGRRDAYLPGVQALYRSLRLVESLHPLIVMHTRGVR